MTDRDALLEAVFAAPDDDAPRLVYADWLDENGHPEQADFIRRQIELYRTPADDPTRPARTAAVEASWNRFKVRLTEALPATELRLDLYSRGLPEQDYDTTADRFLADAADWWPVFPVRQLSLSRWVERVREVCGCGYLRRVTDLTLRFAEVNVHVARALVASPQLVHVRRLRIHAHPLSREASRLLRGHFGKRLDGIS